MKKAIVLILSITALTSFGQERRIEFEEYKLSNGLHVILHRDNSTPIVAVSSAYHVGSKDEEVGKTGFAHFFEHVASRKSTNIPVGGFTEYVSDAGGSRNATTNFDRTYYYELLPSNQLELGLWLESERMFNMVVDTGVVETEREVVKEERRLRNDNQPYGTLIEEILVRSFTKHHYRWPVIGSMADLDNATVADFEAFKNKFYVPNNAVLSIAGDIEIEETKRLVELYFGEFAKGPEIKRESVMEPQQKMEVVDTVYDNVQLPALVMAYHIPAIGTDDYYAMNMLNLILANGQSSRMNKKLVDETQLAVFAGAFDLASEDPGISLAFGVANAGISLVELGDAMQSEIDRMKNEIVPEKEFQKVLNQIENNFISGNASIAGIAGSLANYYLIRGNTNLINTELEKFLAVTPQDVQNAAKKYLKDSNRVTLHWLPKPQ
ncbi:MAG: pitrilysin family protein [Cyclobacteriaceae bacterium]